VARYVAFLRGMNLGRRRVKNEELCACFESMGFGDVAAFLASGNVIFSTSGKGAAKLESFVEAGLKRHFEYEVKTFVRSAKEVGAIAGHQPFSKKQLAASTGNVQVALLSKPPAPSSCQEALALKTPDDQLAIEGRELYWLPKGNMSDSELDLDGLATALGPVTMRAQRTMMRLAEKLEV